MANLKILIQAWLPDGVLERWRSRITDVDFLDGRDPAELKRHLPSVEIVYGLPPVAELSRATSLKWIQLISAGVPQDLCPVAKSRGVQVTNLAGLYGPTIAEHAICLMTVLARNLQVALRNQAQACWDRTVRETMFDLRGRTLGLVGLGNIGQNIARLARAFGMRVIGVRRTGRAAPDVDRVFPLAELHAMLAETDVLAVAAPLTARTQGILGRAEFAALKRGALYINVSRGPVADEAALTDALRSGQVAAAGLDVFAVEPLPPDHPFWSMPQVLVSPHYSGETVNLSSQPAERFLRNLAAWRAGQKLEGIVDLDWGY